MKQRVLFIIATCILTGSIVFAALPQRSQIQSHYDQGQYESALEKSLLLVSEYPQNASLLFNTGNIYYRLGGWGYAKYYYLKALQLRPRDADIRYNLAIINAHLIDSESVSNSVIKKIFVFLDYITFKEALFLSILFLSGFSICLGVYSFKKKNELIKNGIWIFIALFLILFGVTCAKYYFQTGIQKGVIISKKISVKGSPIETLPTLFFIHQGIQATVLKATSDWKEIRLSNGFTGWIKSNHIKML